MPGTLAPGQMYDHECNVLKGYWDLEGAVTKHAELAADETILAGSLFYLDANGKARSGSPDNTVAIFANQNSTDFDVSADVGNIQTAVMAGFPCISNFELQTTEFDTTQTYAPNDHLTGWSSTMAGYTTALKGKIGIGVPYTDTLCGVVTEGATANDHGKNVVSLWTYYLPIAPTTPVSE